MPAPIVIRRDAPADWDRLRAIHDRARVDELRGSVDPAAFLSLEDTYEGEGLFDGEVWVAETQVEAQAESQAGIQADAAAGPDPEVVGFVALADDEVTWLCVDPERTRWGIGRALLRHALGRCDADAEVEVTVLSGNAPAVALYLSVGFAIVETRAGKLSGNEAFPATGHIMRRAAAAAEPVQ
jgi:ribosomal protein S18 acetylase RimI-like enzyme